MDLSRLNCYVKREQYQSSTPAQAVADIAAEEAKVFTKLYALKGYHQCPLNEASRIITTFITPFGRFQFLRAPFGISSISGSEHYNQRMDEAFTGLEVIVVLSTTWLSLTRIRSSMNLMSDNSCSIA